MTNIDNLMMIFKGITEQQNNLHTLLDDTLKEALLEYKVVFDTNTITFGEDERVEVLFGGRHNTKLYFSYITELVFDDEGVPTKAKIGADDIKCQSTFLFGVDDEYAEPNVLMNWEDNLLSMVLNKLGKQLLGKGVVDYLER